MSNTTSRKSTTRKMTIVVLAVFLLIAIIGGTYARYTSTASGNTTAQVAKWAVKINETDIVSGNEFTVDFTEVKNDNVVDGRIAPSSTLYADFEVDPTGSEVAIDYSFVLGEITASTGNVPAGLTVSKVCTVAEDKTETALTAEEGKYKGTINLVSQTAALTANDKVKVRVYVEWANNEDNNATDTSVGSTAPELTMQVTGTATQHI